MSHGIKRTRETREAVQARKQKELYKIAQYCTLSEDVLKRKRSCDWSLEALNLTKQLLYLNPEFYTVWNYRRNILVNGVFPSKSPSEVNDLLSNDLSMTMAALRLHPKVYWIWNHRRWCLEHVPDAAGDDPDKWRKDNWTKELYVVEKVLDVDARNFHAWGYRRYILSSMTLRHTPAQELAYTKRKIESNFSNFSAWHQRSKVYCSMWEDNLEPERMAQAMDEEFELIKQALYTDPGDQSVWLYHRWLVGSGSDEDLLTREIQVIEELLMLEPERCLESLVHYKSLLLQHGHSAQLILECVGMLGKLENLDPFRKERYRELAKNIRHSIQL